MCRSASPHATFVLTSRRVLAAWRTAPSGAPCRAHSVSLQGEVDNSSESAPRCGVPARLAHFAAFIARATSHKRIRIEHSDLRRRSPRAAAAFRRRSAKSSPTSAFRMRWRAWPRACSALEHHLRARLHRKVLLQGVLARLSPPHGEPDDGVGIDERKCAGAKAREKVITHETLTRVPSSLLWLRLALQFTRLSSLTKTNSHARNTIPCTRLGRSCGHGLQRTRSGKQ